jgi:peptide/nickel transport system ATP-binding protein
VVNVLWSSSSVSDPVVRVSHLTTQFRSGKRHFSVVDDVSFQVNDGETLAIVGESGAGKSVTALSIMRLLPPQSGRISAGEIWFGGVDLASIPDERMRAIRGNKIAMIFQEPMSALNPVLTVGHQIGEVLVLHKALSTADARLRAAELLRTVGFARVEALLDEYPHRLSGGMRQRVMLAMAIACEPRLLIADEPTTALDVTVQAQVLELMRELTSRMGSAVMLITHNLGVVAELADRVIIMYAGQIVEQATALELFDRPAHPYTQGLMQSVPTLDRDQQRLSSIPGSVPAPDAYPRGCRFSTRCGSVMPVCREQSPPLFEVGPGHLSRCFLHTAHSA